MGFIHILGRIGHGAEVVGKDVLKGAGAVAPIVGDVYPPLAPIMNLVAGISHMIPAAAATALPNDQKKGLVLTAAEAAVPAILELLAAKTGHTVTDEPRFARAVDGLIENLLDLQKCFGAVPTNTPVPPPVPNSNQGATE